MQGSGTERGKPVFGSIEAPWVASFFLTSVRAAIVVAIIIAAI